MSDAVLRIEDVLAVDKNSFETNQDSSKSKPDSCKNKKKNKGKAKKGTTSNIPRGVPVSGRTWKTQKKRFSSVIKTRGYKTANKFEKLKVLKGEVNRVRALTKSIVEQRKKEIEEKKERRRLKLQRQKENQLKAEIVQVIRNPAKIKRMKRKQLRYIEKRDTLSKM